MEPNTQCRPIVFTSDRAAKNDSGARASRNAVRVSDTIAPTPRAGSQKSTGGVNA